MGCSGDDAGHADPTNSSPPTSDATSSSTTSNPAPTTEPPSTDLAALTPVLQALWNRYDDAVDAILADTRVASDRNDPAVQHFLSFYPPDSSVAAALLQHWTDEVAKGRFYQEGPLENSTTVVEIKPGASADAASATVCHVDEGYQIVDASGTALEAYSASRVPLAADVVRIDGTWRFDSIHLLQDPDGICPDTPPGQEP